MLPNSCLRDLIVAGVSEINSVERNVINLSITMKMVALENGMIQAEQLGVETSERERKWRKKKTQRQNGRAIIP